tara:strand:- start:126 stop:329 length:204 start_codon:yes stop_codon:yes gene_type:complete
MILYNPKLYKKLRSGIMGKILSWNSFFIAFLFFIAVVFISGCSTYGTVEMNGKKYSTGIFVDSEWAN